MKTKIHLADRHMATELYVIVGLDDSLAEQLKLREPTTLYKLNNNRSFHAHLLNFAAFYSIVVIILISTYAQPVTSYSIIAYFHESPGCSPSCDYFFSWQKDSANVESGGMPARKMIHSTMNCHIPAEDEPGDRTEVLYGNMDKELQARVIRHVNKYWDPKNAMPSIYPILLKLEREIGPGWRVDKIQNEQHVRADAVVKSTVNFKVSPDPTMYSIWRQQVPQF
ncbi:hypothetical protein CLF_109501 [Clonorchis sinensis]|uniref:Uncharacterized protein n=1 Tax=Clonorchis sinensis TaxID=79923 RepID=H2KUL9_CLOSI|nr:hypothetical protein CLF_109501 [Clonorchis sinensis]